MKSALPLPASRRDVLRWAGGGAACLAAPAVQAQGAQTLRLGLEGRLDGTHAPFLLALDRGFFRDEGLLVSVESVASARELLSKLASGGLDLGLCDSNAMIRFRDEAPASDLRATLMVQDRAPYAIVGRQSRGITQDVKSLEGKKLAAPAVESAVSVWPVFRALNQLNATSITLEPMGLPVREPMLASGEVDAALGSSVSLFVNLKARNLPIDDLVIIAMADHGLKLYGQAIVAASGLRQQQGEVLAAFHRAIIRAVRVCLASPLDSVLPVIRTDENLNRETETERLQRSLAQDVATPWVKSYGFGAVDPVRLEEALVQLALGQAFKTKITASDLFDDRFLPSASARML